MILSTAEIGGLKVDIILDTGAQSSMGNFALRDRMRKRDRRFDYMPVQMRSVTGDILLGDFTQIRTIKIGGVDINDLPITFADNYAFKALNLDRKPAILLGMDAMKLSEIRHSMQTQIRWSRYLELFVGMLGCIFAAAASRTSSRWKRSSPTITGVPPWGGA
jgi:hypothetical protein